MKIKEVCEKTELTSRTIRLYIEEGLVSPKYSENYLGRKSYDFSSEDVSSFINVATLRRYGFSIAEIHEIIADKDSSTSIINDICNRKSVTIQFEKDTLSALLQLNDGKVYSIDEIAVRLNSYQEKRELPKDDTISKFGYLLKNPKEVFGLIDKLFYVLSLGVAVFYIVHLFTEWRYPYIPDIPLGLLILFLISLPALFVVVLGLVIKNLKKKRKKFIPAGVIAVFIVLLSLLPVCFLGLIGPVQSFTTDINNYRILDEYKSTGYSNSFYNELFPYVPGGAIRENDKWVYPNSKYYYRCRAAFDFTVDLYAEWPLDEGKFNKEVERVKKLYQAYKTLDADDEYHKHTEINKGNYTCLIRYYGGTPFDNVEDDYEYFIFAFDEENLRVRYIFCHSEENGAEQPYYLELEW